MTTQKGGRALALYSCCRHCPEYGNHEGHLAPCDNDPSCEGVEPIG